MANADGTPALIEVFLTRHLLHEHLMTGPVAAPRTGASTADAIAPEARRPGGPDTAGTGTEPEEVLPSAASSSRAGIAPPPAAVRDGQPHDKHPLPPPTTTSSRGSAGLTDPPLSHFVLDRNTPSLTSVLSSRTSVQDLNLYVGPGGGPGPRAGLLCCPSP